MNKYTIYCTTEQTKKAIRLGAPIEMNSHSHGRPYIQDGVNFLICPTTEQMISWLENKSLQVTIHFRGNSWYYNIMSGYKVLSISKNVSTRVEATLTAIDAALEYLNNKK